MVVKASELEFLFGIRKPLFSGMCRFCFLLEASWETVTFRFFFSCYFLFYFFLIPTKALTWNVSWTSTFLNERMFFIWKVKTFFFYLYKSYNRYRDRKIRQTTKLHLVVKLQFWNTGEFGVFLCCHSDLEY